MALDPAKAKLAATYEAPGILFAAAYDPQHNKLYGAGTDWSVYCLDLNAEKPKPEKKWTNHDNYVSALVLRGDNVISAGYDSRIIWTNAASGETVRTVAAHDGWVRDLVLLPDGKRLASAGDDMLVKIFAAETGELLQTFSGHDKQTPQGYATALYTVAVTPDGKFIAGGDRIGTVCIWEAATGKLLHKLQSPNFYTYDPTKRVRSIGGIRNLRFSPDGKTLAIAGIGQVTNVDGFVGPCRVELWDWQAGKPVKTCQDKHKAVFNHVVFHPTEPLLIAAGGGDSGGILAFWDMKTEKLTHKAKPKGHIQRLLIDPSGKQLFLAGHAGFQVWKLA